VNNTIIFGADSTWYFHFGSSVGLGKCDDSSGNPRQNCIDALQDDLADFLTIGQDYNATYKIGGKPVILYYLDPSYMTPDQWTTMFNNVRNQLKMDFYVLGSTEDASFFASFDALCPWVNLEQWASASGSSTYEKAYNWVTSEHSQLFNAVKNYPGRVVFGGVAPGFDDYTLDWGNCKPRQIPRDPDVLKAEFDFLTAKGVQGVLFQTWDDYTEGTAMEPNVNNGSSVLVQVRQGLGQMAHEAPDPNGDKRLANRWLTYGQARNCKGGKHGIPPVIDLKC